MRFTTQQLPSWVGFDRMFDELERATANVSKAVSFPPYNLKKTGDNTYVIEMAVAGFARSDIEITLDNDQLVVKGEAKADPNANYIFKGIAERAFERSFTLADAVVVKNAGMYNGMLKILLEHIIPEDKKPRRVEIVETDSADLKTVDQPKLKA
jgi:molecular chaperone IbpA